MIYTALRYLFDVLQFAIFARVIISWLPIPKENQIIKFLYQITEPIMAPIRGMIERSSFGKNMMFDFSPIIALLLIQFIRTLIGV
jgi:YggT family protein